MNAADTAPDAPEAVTVTVSVSAVVSERSAVARPPPSVVRPASESWPFEAENFTDAPDTGWPELSVSVATTSTVCVTGAEGGEAVTFSARALGGGPAW